MNSCVAKLDEETADGTPKTCLNLKVVCVGMCIGAGVTEGVDVDAGVGVGTDGSPGRRQGVCVSPVIFFLSFFSPVIFICKVVVGFLGGSWRDIGYGREFSPL